MRISWFAAIVLGVLGCDSPKLQRAPSESASTATFRIGVDSQLHAGDLKYFQAMKEPLLDSSIGPSDTESIRFFWRRSFHSPVAVRATRRGSQFALVSVTLANEPEAGPGAIIQRDSIPITRAQWNDLVERLQNSRLWRPEPLPPGVLVTDGASWAIESTLGGKYRVIDAWSPEQNGRATDIRSFGLTMLSMSGRLPPLADIY